MPLAHSFFLVKMVRAKRGFRALLFSLITIWLGTSPLEAALDRFDDAVLFDGVIFLPEIKNGRTEIARYATATEEWLPSIPVPGVAVDFVLTDEYWYVGMSDRLLASSDSGQSWEVALDTFSRLSRLEAVGEFLLIEAKLPDAAYNDYSYTWTLHRKTGEVRQTNGSRLGSSHTTLVAPGLIARNGIRSIVFHPYTEEDEGFKWETTTSIETTETVGRIFVFPDGERLIDTGGNLVAMRPPQQLRQVEPFDDLVFSASHPTQPVLLRNAHLVTLLPDLREDRRMEVLFEPKRLFGAEGKIFLVGQRNSRGPITVQPVDSRTLELAPATAVPEMEAIPPLNEAYRLDDSHVAFLSNANFAIYLWNLETKAFESATPLPSHPLATVQNPTTGELFLRFHHASAQIWKWNRAQSKLDLVAEDPSMRSFYAVETFLVTEGPDEHGLRRLRSFGSDGRLIDEIRWAEFAPRLEEGVLQWSAQHRRSFTTDAYIDDEGTPIKARNAGYLELSVDGILRVVNQWDVPESFSWAPPFRSNPNEEFIIARNGDRIYPKDDSYFRWGTVVAHDDFAYVTSDTGIALGPVLIPDDWREEIDPEVSLLSRYSDRVLQADGSLQIKGTAGLALMMDDQLLVVTEQGDQPLIHLCDPLSLLLTYSTPAPPVSSTSLTGTVSGHSTVHLTWEDRATDEQGYRIYRKGDRTNDPNELVGVTGTNVTNFTDRTLSPSTYYRYTVVAFNEWGESPASPSLRIRTTTREPQGTAKIEILEVTATDARLSLAAELVNSGIAEAFYRRADTVDPWQSLGPVNATARIATLPNLSPNSPYDLYIVATNSFGETALSSFRSFLTKPQAGTYLQLHQEYAGIHYFCFGEPAALRRYDRSSGAWLPPLPLPLAPESLLVAEEGIFISHGEEIWQAKPNSTGFQQITEATGSAVNSMAVSAGRLYLTFRSYSSFYRDYAFVDLAENHRLSAPTSLRGENDAKISTEYFIGLESGHILFEGGILGPQPDGTLTLLSPFNSSLPALEDVLDLAEEHDQVLFRNGRLYRLSVGERLENGDFDLIDGAISGANELVILSEDVSRALHWSRDGSPPKFSVEAGDARYFYYDADSDSITFYIEDKDAPNGFQTLQRELQEDPLDKATIPAYADEGLLPAGTLGVLQGGDQLFYWTPQVGFISGYNLATRLPLAPLALHSPPVQAALWEEHNHLILGSGDQTVSFLNLETGEERFIASLPGSITAIAAHDERALVGIRRQDASGRTFSEFYEFDFEGDGERNSTTVSSRVDKIAWIEALEQFVFRASNQSRNYDGVDFPVSPLSEQSMLSQNGQWIIDQRARTLSTTSPIEVLYTDSRLRNARWWGNEIVIPKTSSRSIEIWDTTLENVRRITLPTEPSFFFLFGDDLVAVGITNGFPSYHYIRAADASIETTIPREFEVSLAFDPSPAAREGKAGEWISTLKWLFPPPPGTSVQINVQNSYRDDFAVSGMDVYCTRASSFPEGSDIVFPFTITFPNGNQLYDQSARLRFGNPDTEPELNLNDLQLSAYSITHLLKQGYLVGRLYGSGSLEDKELTFRLAHDPSGLFEFDPDRPGSLYLMGELPTTLSESYTIGIEVSLNGEILGEREFTLSAVNLSTEPLVNRPILFEPALFPQQNPEFISGQGIAIEGKAGSMNLRSPNSSDRFPENDSFLLEIESTVAIRRNDGSAFSPIYVDIALSPDTEERYIEFSVLSANGYFWDSYWVTIPPYTSDVPFHRIYFPPDWDYLEHLRIDHPSFALKSLRIKSFSPTDLPLVVLMTQSSGAYVPSLRGMQFNPEGHFAQISVLRYGPSDGDLTFPLEVVGAESDRDFRIFRDGIELDHIELQDGEFGTYFSVESLLSDSSIKHRELQLNATADGTFEIFADEPVMLTLYSSYFEYWQDNHLETSTDSSYSPELRFLLDLNQSLPPKFGLRDIAGFPKGYFFEFSVNRLDRNLDLELQQSSDLLEWTPAEAEPILIPGSTQDDYYYYLGNGEGKHFWRFQPVSPPSP